MTICLQQKDITHLEKFKAHLQTDYKIKKAIDNTGYTYCKICCYSKEMCCTLKEKFNIVPAKSLILTYPKNLDRSLERHFIRGYFDSDGSFSFNQKKIANCCLSFAGTLDFLMNVQQVLIENCGLNKVRIFPSGSIFILAYSGRKQVQKLFDYLYQNATVYLDRKYEKLLNYLN